MLNDPEFLEAVARAQEEINFKLRNELCRHGERAFADDGTPTPCEECLKASAERAGKFWVGTKDYMDGVKPADAPGTSGPQNTSFTETPGFPEPEKRD